MKHIIIKSKKKVFGSLLGRNLSTFKGSGVDFREVREYIYGEDAKRIDWKISAKFQKPFVKEFDEERELNIIVCILASGSLNFGSVRLKSDLISEIVALLGFSAIKFDDKFNLIIYEKKPLFHSKPTKTQKGVIANIERVYNFDFLKKEWDNSFCDYLNRFKKSILFLIGDFYKLPKLTLKHETYLIWVRDKFEENPSPLEEVDLIDPNNLIQIHTNLNRKNISSYIKNLQSNDEKLIHTLQKEKIKFTRIYTDEEPFYKLTELLR
ncbi:DUF58 domain-containing protein [Caminibacter sp.]